MIIPNQQYLPTQAAVTCSPSCRCADHLLAVLGQFGVLSHVRYRPFRSENGTLTTFCNIFLWDCTRALGCEIPHWADPVTGEPVPVNHGEELSANKIVSWLATHGQRFGWMPITPEMANLLAHSGRPVVAVWANPHGPGHVVMLGPSADGSAGPTIYQAGAQNLFGAPLSHGFGSIKPIFYAHN